MSDPNPLPDPDPPPEPEGGQDRDPTEKPEVDKHPED